MSFSPSSSRIPKLLGVPSSLLDRVYQRRGIQRLPPFKLPVLQLTSEDLALKAPQASFTECSLYHKNEKVNVSPYWGLTEQGQQRLLEAHQKHPRALVVRWPKEGQTLTLHNNSLVTTTDFPQENKPITITREGTDAAMREAMITLARSKGMIPTSIIYHADTNWQHHYHPRTMHRDGSKFQTIHHHPITQKHKADHVLNIAVPANSLPFWLQKHSRNIRMVYDDMSGKEYPYYVHRMVRRPHIGMTFLLQSSFSTQHQPPTMHQAAGTQRALTTLLYNTHSNTKLTADRANDWGYPVISSS
ncbi:MAG: hypothetical protein ACKO37_01555 [Vampirovibrionales bacterium]